ncbi:MAG: MFS transporter [Hydrococcus sp. Prado102]|jgi:MFS family permease|nr:MFS transporter [Hydrococcus sp. Prado102]
MKIKLSSNLRSLPRTVWILGFVSLFMDISTETIHSVLPLFLVSMGTNLVVLGFIEGIGEVVATVLKVFSGRLSDVWQRRKDLLVFGYGLSALSKPLFAIAISPSWILLARIVDRMGKGIRGAPRNALIADVTPLEQRGSAFGLRKSLDSIGAVIGPILATVLMAISQQNFRWVFWVAVFPAITAAILLASQVRESPSNRSRVPALSWQILNDLSPAFWQLTAIIAVFHLGNSSEAFLLLRSQQFDIAPTVAPLLLMVMNVTYSITAYPLGRLSDRVGRVRFLVLGFGLYTIVYLGFAFAGYNWQIWGLFALYGVYLGSTQGLLSAIVADLIAPGIRGTAFGVFDLVMGTTVLVANLLAGWFWQQFEPSVTFVVGSACAIASAAMLLLWQTRTDL